MIMNAGPATAETDAILRERYNAKGLSAARRGLPREFSGDPSSMVGGWWFEGYDSAVHMGPASDAEDDRKL